MKKGFWQIAMFLILLCFAVASCDHQGIVDLNNDQNGQDQVKYRIFYPDEIRRPDDFIVYVYFPASWFSFIGKPTINVFGLNKDKYPIQPSNYEIQNPDPGFENYYRVSLPMRKDGPAWRSFFFEVGNDTGSCCELLRAHSCRLDYFYWPYNPVGDPAQTDDLIAMRVSQNGVVDKLFDPLDTETPLPYTSIRFVPKVQYLGYSDGQHHYNFDAGLKEYTKEIGVSNVFWVFPYDPLVWPGIKRSYSSTRLLQGQNALLTIVDGLNNKLEVPVKIP